MSHSPALTPTQRVRRNGRLAALAALSVLVVAAALDFFGLTNQRIISTCPMLHLTGLPCPLCGMTRAFAALSAGRVAQAVSFNFAAPALFLAVVAWGVLGAAQWMSARPVLDRIWRRAGRPIVYTLGVVVAVAWVAELWVRLAG
ncbi:hypothetical protein CVU37_14450 [candidate division BRC1 bacterium HGW-BRC1-1]|nr:MAG: hypothetical protein CVU37_14450 [candidate division BRC1 bacterium HGW-BRC1-1]